MTSITTTPVVKGMRIRLQVVAPVTAQFIGEAGIVNMVYPNAIGMKLDNGKSIFVHLGWGTKKNPGDLSFEVL